MNINNIVKSQKCLSCGACESSCPTHAITLYYCKTGFYQPRIDNAKCVNCALCLKNCPAGNMGSSSLIGYYERIVLAHSTNIVVRHNATSGGVICTLVKYLLDKNIVECVLMVGYSAESPIEADGVIITLSNVNDLQTRTRDFSSRYVTVPLLKSIKKLSTQYKRIAVVGTPCQIRAVNLMQKNNVLKFNTLIKIGVACSGGMSYLATKEYKVRKKMTGAKMYYRGDGWPGKNCLEDDSKKIENSHLGSLYERMFSSQIFKNHGCRLCQDQFAEEADISLCDFWNDNEIKFEKTGNSCCIVRSKTLNDIVSSMEDDNEIEIVRRLSEEETINTQKAVLLYKKSNLRTTVKYRLFMRGIDIIFYTKIYKLFGIKTYRRICKMYSLICQRGGVSDIT